MIEPSNRMKSGAACSVVVTGSTLGATAMPRTPRLNQAIRRFFRRLAVVMIPSRVSAITNTGSRNTTIIAASTWTQKPRYGLACGT